MAQMISDRRDIDFVLYEQHEVAGFAGHERYREFDRKVVDMVVTEAKNLSLKEILPTWKIGDAIGCRFEKGDVKTPEEFKRVWRLLREGEWLAMDRSPEWGGQGMPETVAMAAREYLVGANMALMMFGFMNHGAGRLIEVFGTEQQKALYLEKVYSGEWGATMLLTESEAGSDLSMISTTATRNTDGTYLISGSKIFISGGEQDLTENIIHPVLARIEGAPPGSAGISLFLVPKVRVNPDGSLGELNDIVCTGIEEKMGIHGSPTCAMALGSKGNCIGTLLGQENKGLSSMFIMMNEARLMVGTQALACASSSYLHALQFAGSRIQGSVLGSKDKQQVSIIHHPDVRRMLLHMKMHVEGMRSLLYFIASCEDRKHLTKQEDERERYQNLIDVLIPVAKAYVSDRAVDVCNLGVQVLGGCGYTREYPVEQLLRDVRVVPIYEGSNGIQGMDLLGRKLGLKKGEAFKDVIREIEKTITDATGITHIKPLAEKMKAGMEELEKSAQHLLTLAGSPDFLKAYVNAAPFMEVMGDIIMAWMLLWRAVLAAKKLASGAAKKDQAFYSGQINSAENFIRTVLPVTLGKVSAIFEDCDVAVKMPDEAFGS